MHCFPQTQTLCHGGWAASVFDGTKDSLVDVPQWEWPVPSSFPGPKSAGTSVLQAELWAPYGPVSLALLGVHCHWTQGSPVGCGCQMPTEHLLALLGLRGQG